jgi:hypothetical protein
LDFGQIPESLDYALSCGGVIANGLGISKTRASLSREQRRIV